MTVLAIEMVNELSSLRREFVSLKDQLSQVEQKINKLSIRNAHQKFDV